MIGVDHENGQGACFDDLRQAVIGFPQNWLRDGTHDGHLLSRSDLAEEIVDLAAQFLRLAIQPSGRVQYGGGCRAGIAGRPSHPGDS